MYKRGWMALFLCLSLPSSANTLRVGDWQAHDDPNRYTYHESRDLTWWRGERVIRTCKESRFGRYETGEQGDVYSIKGHVTNQMLDNACDFITLTEAGWTIAPNAKESRAAYLRQWLRW